MAPGKYASRSAPVEVSVVPTRTVKVCGAAFEVDGVVGAAVGAMVGAGIAVGTGVGVAEGAHAVIAAANSNTNTRPNLNDFGIFIVILFLLSKVFAMIIFGAIFTVIELLVA
jgi:predicted acylesterase/phospholipase RssA